LKKGVIMTNSFLCAQFLSLSAEDAKRDAGMATETPGLREEAGGEAVSIRSKQGAGFIFYLDVDLYLSRVFYAGRIQLPFFPVFRSVFRWVALCFKRSRECWTTARKSSWLGFLCFFKQKMYETDRAFYKFSSLPYRSVGNVIILRVGVDGSWLFRSLQEEYTDFSTLEKRLQTVARRMVNPRAQGSVPGGSGQVGNMSGGQAQLSSQGNLSQQQQQQQFLQQQRAAAANQMRGQGGMSQSPHGMSGQGMGNMNGPSGNMGNASGSGGANLMSQVGMQSQLQQQQHMNYNQGGNSGMLQQGNMALGGKNSNLENSNQQMLNRSGGNLGTSGMLSNGSGAMGSMHSGQGNSGMGSGNLLQVRRENRCVVSFRFHIGFDRSLGCVLVVGLAVSF
jgi:hypothetical protein